MATRLRGRLPPLLREALAEFMATFILVVCNDFHCNFVDVYSSTLRQFAISWISCGIFSRAQAQHDGNGNEERHQTKGFNEQYNGHARAF